MTLIATYGPSPTDLVHVAFDGAVTELVATRSTSLTAIGVGCMHPYRSSLAISEHHGIAGCRMS